MRPPKLIICRGLPASGKTTWAKEQVRTGLRCHQEPVVCNEPELHKVCRINRDDIRAMLHDGTYIRGLTEEVVIAARNASVVAALRKGWDVISDDTNLKSRNVRDLMKIARREGAEVEFKDFTDVPLAECIIRDSERQNNGFRYVGTEVIVDTYDRFLRNKPFPLPIPELEDRPKFAPLERGRINAVICDIDGTVAHNNGHRGWYEYDKVLADDPKYDILRLVKMLQMKGHDIIFVSGRKDSCREETAKWLAHNFDWPALDDYKLPNDEQHGPNRLYMRRSDDDRDDALVKYEFYRDYIAPVFDVRIVFDDRDRVVKMWREVGLTCAQVAEGDF